MLATKIDEYGDEWESTWQRSALHTIHKNMPPPGFPHSLEHCYKMHKSIYWELLADKRKIKTAESMGRLMIKEIWYGFVHQ